MTARRSFLARIGAVAAAVGLGSAKALAERPLDGHAQETTTKPASGDARWQPARHAKDDWLDELPGKHRLFFDALTPDGVNDALRYANNFFTGNKNGYGLEPADVVVVICMRHRATQFAFTDAVWGKYGAALSESDKFTDPKTGQAPVVNFYRTLLESHIKRGVRFAACDLSTHRLAAFIARKIDGSADAIYKELVANAMPNVHFVPAGIVAVNRAQERGYSIAHAG